MRRWRRALRNAFRLAVWSDHATSAQARAHELALTAGRGERFRAGVAGIGAGAVLTVLGFWLGRAIERWLDAATDHGWSAFAQWGGDAGLLPYAPAGLAGIVALMGMYRVATAAIPWLASGSALAGVARILLLAFLGTLAVVTCVLAGLIDFEP